MTDRKVIPIPANAPKTGEVFRHYKGDLYKVKPAEQGETLLK